MKLPVLLLFLFLYSVVCYSQNDDNYEASDAHPFGRVNPKAPDQIKDYSMLIGSCDCLSTQRNPSGTFQDTLKSQWEFKYILNGMAIQDVTLKSDGSSSSSIRQYNADSARWYVTYFAGAAANPTPKTWAGKAREGSTMVLFADQKAPNGMQGNSRLTFYDISEKGFKWKGEWLSKDGTIVFPFWMIECKKNP